MPHLFVADATANTQTLTGNGEAPLDLGTITEGDPTSADYTFSNISWGDSSSQGTITLQPQGALNADGSQNYEIVGSHTYSAQGNYTISFTVNETAGAAPGGTINAVDETSVTTTNSSALISDTAAINPLSGNGIAVSAQEDTSIAPDTEVASFSDAAYPQNAAYTATINWGDGTTSDPATIAIVDNTLYVENVNAHAYTEFGNYPMTVTITDPGGNTFTTAPVTNAISDMLNGSISLASTPVAGVQFNGQVATFTDPNPYIQNGNFSALINWGDGNSTSGVVGGEHGSFFVIGTHTYASAGSENIDVQIVDNFSSPYGGTGATIDPSSTINVASPLNPGPPLTLSLMKAKPMLW